MTSSAFPSRAHTYAGPATGSDLARQVVVLVSAVVAVAVSVLGSGAFAGTPVAEAAGGALDADATLVAPAGPAFSIWSVIYAGLIALAVWQVLPARRADPRQRRTGWLIAGTMLANAAWILTVQADSVAGSAVVIVILLALLVATLARLIDSRPDNAVEAVVVDGTMGLYAGWVSIATVANIAAALKDAGVGDLGLGETLWAQVMLVVAAGIGIGVAVVGGGRLAFGAALAWGLAWIAVNRSGGESESIPVAVVAAVAAVVVALATIILKARALRARQTETQP